MDRIMSKIQSTTMSDKLFDLCEMQLVSIIYEAETSIARVTESTNKAVEESAELIELVESASSNNPAEPDLCSKLETSVNDIVVNMQFFDELSQRIEHIMEIVTLIKIESNKEGFLSNPQDSEELFNDIKDIFSIRSEFEVMRSIFPEYGEVETSNAVEIF